MGNIIDFEKASKQTEEKSIEDKARFYSMGIALQTLVDLTQEINAVVHYLEASGFEGKQMGEAIKQNADLMGIDTMYAISELLDTHGNNLVNMGKYIKEKAKGRIPAKLEILEAKETLTKGYGKSHKLLIRAYNEHFIESLKKDAELNTAIYSQAKDSFTEK